MSTFAPYLAMAGGAAMLGGTALQWAANNKASHAQEREALYNSYAETDLANQTEVSTRLQAYAARRRNDMDMGSAFASAAVGYGGGLRGSAQDVLLDMAVQEELEIMTIRYQGYLDKRAHETAAKAGVRASQSIASGRPVQNAATIVNGLANAGMAFSRGIG